MRLSALFEEFCQFLRVEKEAAPRSIETYRWCFGDFSEFATRNVGGTVLVTHLTTDRCRDYQHALSARGLQANSIRVRLATLGSFGKWAVRREKLDKNPLDLLTRPRRRARLPRVPRWETVERLLAESPDPRERAIVALMAYGGLRRSEVLALDVGDYAPEFGLRRVLGKGGHEAAVPLPEVARAIVAEYLAKRRVPSSSRDPMFVVRHCTRGGVWRESRMASHGLWKMIKALGRRAGLPELHPHAFRHGCGVELHRRTGGNLRVVQEHLRHADIQTTTVYTRLTQHELQKAVSVFDEKGN
ncbi:MAG TPA: tyrosine-type recombinase/integrase [Candidatus Methylomirabilis sp.]|nr:tyrosine-type recombinase/integrase [Candidatus Methylomirabilis sp.]